MSLVVLPEAEREIRNAAEYYEGRAVGLGTAFTKLVREAFAENVADPLRFAALETNRTNRDIRRFLLKGFPYVIVYEAREKEAVVLAVAHGRRSPSYWKKRN